MLGFSKVTCEGHTTYEPKGYYRNLGRGFIEIHNDKVNPENMGYKCYLVLNFYTNSEKSFRTLKEAKSYAIRQIVLHGDR